jgi:hypothetical protein
MKLKIFNLLIMLGFLLFTATSCATGPVGSLLFNYTYFPGEVNTTGELVTTKKATGCSYSALGLFSWGDSSAGGIAMENGITRITFVDHHAVNVLVLLYREYCTTVLGE